MSTKRALSWLQTGWNLFIDPAREKRLASYTNSLHRDLIAKKGAFSFSLASDALEIDADERPEIRRRLFGKCMDQAWSDGELTDKELRSLGWLANALEISEKDVKGTMLEHAMHVFSTKMASAFSDGVLDDAEYAELEKVARTCGSGASDFFKYQFRHDGEGFIRNVFHKVWEDGRMDASEWEAIKRTVQRLGMTDVDFREAIRAPAQQLVEHLLAEYKSDDEITNDEAAHLEWMLTHLINDDVFARYVKVEIARINEITIIRRGTLPSISPPAGVAIRSGEIVHFHSTATYSYLRRRGGQSVTEDLLGHIVITDDRLLFISQERSLQVTHSAILGFKRVKDGMDVSTSGKGAGRYHLSDYAERGVEIWISAIRKANQTLVEPQVKDDARKIPRDVRQRVWQKYGARCAECNATQYLEFDHIIPVARGGGNSENNIQLLCRGCNSKKSDSI